MINVWIVVGLIIVIGVACAFIFYKIGMKRGAKEREKELLIDYVWYIPLKDVASFAEELMEDQGVEGEYPLLIIRSDKYDYIEGDDLPSEKKKK